MYLSLRLHQNEIIALDFDREFHGLEFDAYESVFPRMYNWIVQIYMYTYMSYISNCKLYDKLTHMHLIDHGGVLFGENVEK